MGIFWTKVRILCEIMRKGMGGIESDENKVKIQHNNTKIKAPGYSFS